MPDLPAGAPDAAIHARSRDSGASDGIWGRQKAAEFRAFAGRVKGMTSDEARVKADRLDAEADALLDITARTGAPLRVGTGGEATTAMSVSSAFVDTLVECPDMVAVDAGRHRLALAEKAGALAIALDAAETVQAANSLEKMVAHQIAAAHVAAMGLQAEALALLRDFRESGGRYAILTTEAAKLTNASCRMMEMAQRGVATLHRLRNTGRQTIVVQHVHVGEGGRAVVAGEVNGPSRDTRTAQGG
jgi:hypothetical protein